MDNAIIEANATQLKEGVFETHYEYHGAALDVCGGVTVMIIGLIKQLNAEAPNSKIGNKVFENVAREFGYDLKKKEESHGPA